MEDNESTDGFFGKMSILSIIILLIHEHEKSFHVLLSSSVSRFSVLNVHWMIITLSWLDLFQDIFEIIVNGFVFLISFLICFSLIYLESLASEILLDPPDIKAIDNALVCLPEFGGRHYCWIVWHILESQNTFLEAPLLLDNFRYDRRYSVHYQRKVIINPTPAMNTVSYNNDWPGKTCSVASWCQKSYGSNQALSEWN